MIILFCEKVAAWPRLRQLKEIHSLKTYYDESHFIIALQNSLSYPEISFHLEFTTKYYKRFSLYALY
jgi:hypothetical protein